MALCAFYFGIALRIAAPFCYGINCVSFAAGALQASFAAAFGPMAAGPSEALPGSPYCWPAFNFLVRTSPSNCCPS